MLVQEGPDRRPAADRHLAWSLAMVAGGVNGAGFYAAGFYSSHMTGTVSILADRLAAGSWSLALVSSGIVGCFILGAVVSTLLLTYGQRHRQRGIYALSVLAEAFLLAGLAAIDLWVAEIHRGPLLVFGLSALMGLQNAIVTRLSDARIRTTHVTGMITDIGIELGHLLYAVAARMRGRVFTADLTRLKLHVPTVLAFLGGGCLGVLGYKAAGSLVLLGFALLLAGLALPGLLRARRLRPVADSSPLP
jgi:uncharacterized membrane protein YoaK (UPF0700 family)